MAPFGGIERHVCGIARAAADDGHQVRLLTTSNSLGPELRAQLASPRIVFRELARPRLAAGALHKAAWLARELLLAAGRNWDVVYTNGQSALARLAWFAAGRGSRIIHHHHTAADAAEQLTWSRPFRRLLAAAPELVACSQATRRALDAAVARTDTQFLPYLAGSPVAGAQVVDRPPAPLLRFGFCGRLIPEKGIEAILALADDPALPDIEWHIHGSGDAYPAERFQNRPRIFYHGAYRSPAEHARALLALDSLVLFSTHNEGMPLSLIEGMSAGLPWVATDRGGTRELASSPNDALLAPADATVAQLGGAVRTLADRILARATSRRFQRAIYDDRFAPAVVTAQWLQFFRPSRGGSAPTSPC
jgi:glycosyltransferase involved in cell wall biosynthesis